MCGTDVTGTLPGMTTTTLEETVAGIYAAYGRRDIPAILDAFADDIAWDAGGRTSAQDAGVPYLAERHGITEVAGFFSDLAEVIEITDFVVGDLIASGSKVVAEISFRATAHATGRSFDAHELHVWEFGDDGKAVAYQHHVDTGRHMWALGL
jgi:ketosteroid isomerase-like protein